MIQESAFEKCIHMQKTRKHKYREKIDTMNTRFREKNEYMVVLYLQKQDLPNGAKLSLFWICVWHVKTRQLHAYSTMFIHMCHGQKSLYWGWSAHL